MVVSWGEFAEREPELAAFGAGRLNAVPAYLATVRASGGPRVHPFTPIIGQGRFFVFMEPNSPKGRDLRVRPAYAVHNGVPDMVGTGGEFFVAGEATLVSDPDIRSLAVEAASYAPADRYILFELSVTEARCNGYGDVVLPETRRWQATPP